MTTDLNAKSVLAFVIASAIGAIIGTIAVRQAEKWAAGNSVLIKPGP